MATRILIVEDEGIIARDIQQQLLELGYDPVDIAVDGHDAVALAVRLRPQLALMDIHLAGEMDGIEAAKKIRHELDIPCIFLTAFATNDVVERAKQANPSGYIIKPFDAQILRTTIEIALNKERLDRDLRRSQAGLAEAQRMARIGSWEHDFTTDTLTWSPGYFDVYELDPATTKPSFQVFLTSVHPDDRAAVRESFGRIAAGEQEPELVHRLLMRDGRIKWVRQHAQAFFDAAGTMTRALGTTQDITEQRRADQLLRLQSAALNSTTSGVIITDRDGTIEWVNPAFTQMTGYTLADCVGRNPRDLLKSGVHEHTFYERLWSAILAGRVWTAEVTNRKKDGSHYVEEQTITPVRDELGNITHFVGVKRDLTEQKRLEQQFLQAQKMEVVGRLAGGVAHDFNNLLTVIHGGCDLALEDLPSEHPTRVDIEEIRGAAEQATRLTKQLLAFSRKQVLTPAVVNVGAQLEHSAKMLRRLIGEDVKLVIQADPTKRDTVFVDPGQLEQVVLNLAVNARDAMPDGGTLTITTRVVAARDGLDDTAPQLAGVEHVVLGVTDSGVGMTPEVRERIFEPFFTTKGQGKGTGLGLATVYGIVQQSNGAIQVESEVGRGTTIRVLLPRIDAHVEGVEAHGVITRGGETILLVEDEETLRLTMVKMLQAAGYRVLSATRAEEALAVLDRHPDVALVVSDVVMPGMSGTELARLLAQLRPGLRVLLSSGYADEKLAEVAAKHGTNYLSKPFTVAGLTQKVRQILDTPVVSA